MKTKYRYWRGIVSVLAVVMLLLGAMAFVGVFQEPAGAAMSPPSSIVIWGDTTHMAVPAGNNYVAIASGYYHNLAIKSDGSLVGWGSNLDGEATVPSGNNYVAIAAGDGFSLAIKSDNTLVAWGNNIEGQVNVPVGHTYKAVAGGGLHTAAINTSDALEAWGNNSYGQTTGIPAGNDFVEVAAGNVHSLARRSNGSLAAWGNNAYGQCNVPAGTGYKAIAAGGWHSVAIKADGSLVAWGENSDGQLDNIPAGNNYVAIAAGLYHSVALKADGSLVAWGYNNDHQTDVPPGYSYRAISCGVAHSLALSAVPISDLRDAYLAEGSTNWGFDCYLTVVNPNDSAINVNIVFNTSNGPMPGPTFGMPALSQATVFPRPYIGDIDFSAAIHCVEGLAIAADRTMSWNKDNQGTEAHCAVGVKRAEKTWYLAEGSSSWGFECWLLIQNPTETPANCRITYMVENVGPRTRDVEVAPNSRGTYNMAETLTDIEYKDASIKVESSVPVIAERAMYRNNRREGHASLGTTAPAVDFYLAEGAVGYASKFKTFVLVQNPNDTATDVQVIYQTQNGEIAGPTFSMIPNSRHTILVNDQLPNGTNVSTRVHGSQPIVAERAMYWMFGNAEICHDSIGMDSPHATFFLPDGQTSNGMETWVLVQNPNSSAVEVKVSYLTPDGTGNVYKNETIAANSRQTFNMADHSKLNGRAAIKVDSLTPGLNIMVERAMYWNSRGTGTDTIGGYSD